MSVSFLLLVLALFTARALETYLIALDWLTSLPTPFFHFLFDRLRCFILLGVCRLGPEV